MMEPNQKLTRARFALTRDQPFFATILLQLETVMCEITKTIDTDGRQIRCNPAWLDTMPERQLQAALAHNVMHIAFEHPLRLQDRDPALANRAMDLAINPLLGEAGFDLPPDAPIDPAYADMPWERIYALLERQESGDGEQADESGDTTPGGSGVDAGAPSAQPHGQGDAGQGASGDASPATCGEVLPLAGDNGGKPQPAEIREAEGKARVLLVQAAQAARRAGKLGAGLERLVKQQVQPATDWQAVLRRFVRERAQDGYSWSRPNRRHAWRGIILPSPWSQRLGEIVVAVDTSASIRERELAAFAAEAKAIFAEAKPAAVTVLHCDTQVRASRRFTTFDDFDIKAKGGGGTLFQPTFDWVAAEAAQPPVCLIYFTDLDPFDQPQDPGYPVLWAATAARTPPAFGEVVRLQAG